MSKIKFIEKTHQYFTEDNRELISVSKFVERFKAEINWKKLAAGIAARERKQGVKSTVAQVMKRWKEKAKLGAAAGTVYHGIRERELVSEGVTTSYNTQCATKGCDYKKGVKHSLPIHELENNTIYAEWMVYDLDFMICGQIDKAIIADNTINIWDYKTDKEISFVGFSNRWVSPAKMQAPVNHLDDCSGNLYSLKMSLYMYILWKANKGRFKPGEIMIEHVQLLRDEDGIPILKDGKPIVEDITKIKLPYRKREVLEMLATLKPTK